MRGPDCTPPGPILPGDRTPPVSQGFAAAKEWILAIGPGWRRPFRWRRLGEEGGNDEFPALTIQTV